VIDSAEGRLSSSVEEDMWKIINMISWSRSFFCCMVEQEVDKLEGWDEDPDDTKSNR
jgi:hypothetical protein